MTMSVRSVSILALATLTGFEPALGASHGDQELNIHHEASPAIRLISLAPENIVPQRRAYPVAGMIILVMVLEMILFQPPPHALLHRKVVRRIMDCLIKNVTNTQAGKDGRSEPTETQSTDDIKQRSNRDADARRSGDPANIIRIVMMGAVYYEMKTLSPTALRSIMKEIAMDDVFEQRPDQQADHK